MASIDSHGDAHANDGFVLLSENIRYWRNKNNRFGFTIQITSKKEENRTEIVR
jgi:hypothetical protein